MGRPPGGGALATPTWCSAWPSAGPARGPGGHGGDGCSPSCAGPVGRPGTWGRTGAIPRACPNGSTCPPGHWAIRWSWTTRPPSWAPGQQPRRRHGRRGLLLPGHARRAPDAPAPSTGPADRRRHRPGAYPSRVPNGAWCANKAPTGTATSALPARPGGPPPPVLPAAALGHRHWAKVPVLCPPAQPPKICTQSAVTVAPDIGARHRQDLAFGSEQWARTYATYRNSIEGLNGYREGHRPRVPRRPRAPPGAGHRRPEHLCGVAVDGGQLPQDRRLPPDGGRRHRGQGGRACPAPAGEPH